MDYDTPERHAAIAEAAALASDPAMEARCTSAGLKVLVSKSCASSPLNTAKARDTACISICRVFWRSVHSLLVSWHFPFNIKGRLFAAEKEAFVQSMRPRHRRCSGCHWNPQCRAHQPRQTTLIGKSRASCDVYRARPTLGILDSQPRTGKRGSQSGAGIKVLRLRVLVGHLLMCVPCRLIALLKVHTRTRHRPD